MKKLLSVVTATILAAGFAMPLNAAPMFVPKPAQVQAGVVENVNYYHHYHHGHYWSNRYAWRYHRPYYHGYYRPYYPGVGLYPRLAAIAAAARN